MKYRSPDLDKLSRKELIEVIDELKEFGIPFNNAYLNHSTSGLLFGLGRIQELYKTTTGFTYNLIVGEDISSIIVLSIPELDKIYWRNIDEFSNTLTWKNEHILLTKDWSEISEKLFHGLAENDCLIRHSEFSDEIYDHVSEFTVHYRLEDLES
jgi:hypothetical protein